MKKELFSLVALTALVGCATATVTRLSNNAYPPKPDNCDMKVLGNPPTDKKYEELGIVVGDGQGDLDALLPTMKAKACELGADAMVIKNVDASTNSMTTKASAVAIKYILDKK